MNEIKGLMNGYVNRVKGHPFIEAAEKGRLDFDDIITWIFCAGYESKNFPSFLDNLIENQSDKYIINILNENLDDELGNGNTNHSHFSHYLQLLKQLGITEEKFNSYASGEGVTTALITGDAITSQKNNNVSFGYFLVNEGMTPIIYEALKNALLQVRPNISTKFFDLHIESDIEHVNKLFEALKHLIEPIENNELKLAHLLREIEFGMQSGARAMEYLLDEAMGVFDSDFIQLR